MCWERKGLKEWDGREGWVRKIFLNHIILNSNLDHRIKFCPVNRIWYNNRINLSYLIISPNHELRLDMIVYLILFPFSCSETVLNGIVSPNTEWQKYRTSSISKLNTKNCKSKINFYLTIKHYLHLLATGGIKTNAYFH